MMAHCTRKTVHVFSMIPRLAKSLQEKVTDLTIIDIKYPENNEDITSKGMKDEICALQDAEILLIDNHILAQISDELPKVRWAQGTWAGADAFQKSSSKIPAFPVSRMASATFSQLMAEYTIGWILVNEHGWLETRQNQIKNHWASTGKIGEYRCMKEITVGILGMGTIGKQVAKCLKAFHAQVHGLTRTSPSPENMSVDVDKYWHKSELAKFLGHSDYIVNIMPSTPETRGMLSGDIFKDAKKNAVFINIGRGDVVSEGDLIRALDAGWLSGAVLDVFEEEPLPKESKLWTHPKVVVTPHVAGVSRAEDIVEAFLLNYKLFINGQQPNNIIDWKAGY